MATKGLRYPIYAVYDVEAGTYSGGAVAGKGLTLSASYNSTDDKLYADDALQETSKEFTDGTLSAGIHAMTLATRAILLGHTPAAEQAEGFIAASSDIAPYVGFGCYGPKTGGKWRAFWWPKVQFAEPSDEMETKNESVTYKNPTLEGTIMTDKDSKFLKVEDFATEALAKAWLNAFASIV